jgi:hypothetical protein
MASKKAYVIPAGLPGLGFGLELGIGSLAERIRPSFIMTFTSSRETPGASIGGFSSRISAHSCFQSFSSEYVASEGRGGRTV